MGKRKKISLMLAMLAGVVLLTAANINVYREQGGARMVVASGGSLDVESGGEMDIESGGSIKLAGTAISSTAAELNILDGVTSTAAELNILDGVTSTAAELNITGSSIFGVDYTVGSEAGDSREITLQVQDADGNAISSTMSLTVAVFADAAGAAYCSDCGSTGMAAGNTGDALELVDKKLYNLVTNASGEVSLNWLDTGTHEVFLGATLTGGTLDMSPSILNQ